MAGQDQRQRRLQWRMLASLTLRLEEADYQRLREFAFRRGLSHQAVMLDALRRHLDTDDASPAARSGTP